MARHEEQGIYGQTLRDDAAEDARLKAKEQELSINKLADTLEGPLLKSVGNPKEGSSKWDEVQCCAMGIARAAYEPPPGANMKEVIKEEIGIVMGAGNPLSKIAEGIVMDVVQDSMKPPAAAAPAMQAPAMAAAKPAQPRHP